MGILLGIVLFLLACGCFLCMCAHNTTAKVLGGIGGVLFSLLFIFVPFSIHQVEAGQVAVVKVWGEAREIKTAGIHFDLWISRKYEKYDTKVQQTIIVDMVNTILNRCIERMMFKKILDVFGR